MICVAGMSSVIISELKGIAPAETFVRCPWNLRDPDGARDMLPNCDRFIYAAGVLYGRPASQYTAAEAVEAFSVNLWGAIRFVEAALLGSPQARICVVGSMSGIEGSYDEIYAATKAGLHNYCRTRAVRAPQQLFCVAPTIISDARMTKNRKDYPKVLEVRASVTALEVADCIVRNLFTEEPGRCSNEVIELHGQVRGTPS